MTDFVQLLSDHRQVAVPLLILLMAEASVIGFYSERRIKIFLGANAN